MGLDEEEEGYAAMARSDENLYLWGNVETGSAGSGDQGWQQVRRASHNGRTEERETNPGEESAAGWQGS